jgi:hypothetical protein
MAFERCIGRHGDNDDGGTSSSCHKSIQVCFYAPLTDCSPPHHQSAFAISRKRPSSSRDREPRASRHCACPSRRRIFLSLSRRWRWANSSMQHAHSALQTLVSSLCLLISTATLIAQGRHHDSCQLPLNRRTLYLWQQMDDTVDEMKMN